MASTINKPPLTTPMYDANGNLTQPWAQFFIALTGQTAGSATVGAGGVETVQANANITLEPVAQTVIADATNGPFTITLPALSQWIGLDIVIIKIDDTANVVTWVTNSNSETIDGLSTDPMETQWQVEILRATDSETGIIVAETNAVTLGVPAPNVIPPRNIAHSANPQFSTFLYPPGLATGEEHWMLGLWVGIPVDVTHLAALYWYIDGPQGSTEPRRYLAGPFTGVVWRGAWSGASNYAQWDAVSYNGNSYVSLKPQNLNQNPATQPSWWQAKGPNSQNDVSGFALLAGFDYLLQTGDLGLNPDQGVTYIDTLVVAVNEQGSPSPGPYITAGFTTVGSGVAPVPTAGLSVSVQYGFAGGQWQFQVTVNFTPPNDPTFDHIGVSYYPFTTLSQNIDNAQTQVPVHSAAGFTTGVAADYIQIGGTTATDTGPEYAIVLGSQTVPTLELIVERGVNYPGLGEMLAPVAHNAGDGVLNLSYGILLGDTQPGATQFVSGWTPLLVFPASNGQPPATGPIALLLESFSTTGIVGTQLTFITPTGTVSGAAQLNLMAPGSTLGGTNGPRPYVSTLQTNANDAISNPNFDQGVGGMGSWLIEAGAAAGALTQGSPPPGHCCHLQGTISQSLSVQPTQGANPGTTFALSLMAYSLSATTNLVVTVQFYSAANAALGSPATLTILPGSAASAWVLFQFTGAITAPANAAYATLRITDPTTGSNFSSAWYVTAVGLQYLANFAISPAASQFQAYSVKTQSIALLAIENAQLAVGSIANANIQANAVASANILNLQALKITADTSLVGQLQAGTISTAFAIYAPYINISGSTFTVNIGGNLVPPGAPANVFSIYNASGVYPLTTDLSGGHVRIFTGAPTGLPNFQATYSANLLLLTTTSAAPAGGYQLTMEVSGDSFSGGRFFEWLAQDLVGGGGGNQFEIYGDHTGAFTRIGTSGYGANYLVLSPCGTTPTPQAGMLYSESGHLYFYDGAVLHTIV